MRKIVKYALVIICGGKFLINRKRGTRLFLLPGGKPEHGESAEECLAREIREEHNVGVDMGSISFMGEFEDMAANEPDTIIHIKLYSGNIVGEPRPGHEIEEQRWFGKDDDPKILSPIIRNKILPKLESLL
jgi:8-oxo-dGTP diphosphatase